MNRIDRLNALRILLESRRLITAQEIAAHFSLSLRTVYRDVRSLQEAGVAIEGEAGVGYRLSRHAQLSPVAFQSDEALSLLLAVKSAERQLDHHHATLVANAIRKIRAALPATEKDQLERLENKIALSAPGSFSSRETLDPAVLHPIQQALAEGHRLRLCYTALQQKEPVEREIVPIGILYYGGYWHLIAWCQLRTDYRDFRIDRIHHMEILESGQHQAALLTLDQYLQRITGHFTGGLQPPGTLTECIVHISPLLYSYYERTRFRLGFVRQQPITSGPHQGWTAATFYSDDLDTLARWLLSFTDQAAPAAPDSLCSIHRSYLLRIANLLT